ncbi:MAG: alanine--glyoxylate aminotransferase family protein [Armatimonadota bacterium]|nr:alanine--glyoxylate aminotransferase family protein [Armatimonadota bacterium]MDR5696711.1 alanine--glyoxylate aminotransferase family protein [Armatimonadota bacterium]
MDELLLIPGPTPVPRSVREAQARPMMNHRSEPFAQILREVLDGLRWLCVTQQPVLPYASSGTGALEAAVTNVLSPGDRVLALVCGAFGDRFARIAQAYGAEVRRIDTKWGTAVPPERVGDALERDEYRAVLVTHNETSTGVQNDLAAIAAARKDHPALLLVDAVSSLGAIPLEMDAWGVDVVASASQKALRCPPGVAFVAASERAWAAHRQARMPRYYWDFSITRNALEQRLTQTPFTPPVSLFYALQEGLRLIRDEGLPEGFARHRLLSRATRAGIEAMGLRPVAEAGCASWAVTAVWLPEGISAGQVVGPMRDRYGIVLAGGQGQLEGKVFRIGHLGAVYPADILRCMEALERVLRSLGLAVPEAAGVRAAQRVFDEEAAGVA